MAHTCVWNRLIVDQVMHGTSNGLMILGAKIQLPLGAWLKSCHFLRKMLARMERPYSCFQRSGRAMSQRSFDFLEKDRHGFDIQAFKSELSNSFCQTCSLFISSARISLKSSTMTAR